MMIKNKERALSEGTVDNLDESGNRAAVNVFSELMNMFEDALDTISKSVSFAFDGEASDDDNVFNKFCEEFVFQLDSISEEKFWNFL